MRSFLPFGRLPFLAILFAASLAGRLGAAPLKALPVGDSAPGPAIPPVVNSVMFAFHDEGDDHKLIVTAIPGLLRVDEPSDGFSVIYNPATEHYTGLENRNYTYWEFSWPAVREAVEFSKRYETRLRDIGAEGLSGPAPDASLPASSSLVPSLLDTNAPGVGSSASSPPPTSDDSGYVWTPTTQRKRWAGYECVLWKGESVSGEPIEAWCYAGLLPQVQEALTQVRAIEEPMALVPVRTVLPTLVLQVNDALTKGGVTPVRIEWGASGDKSFFALEGIKSREGKASLFAVPHLYVKTTLVTMDGMGNQRPPQPTTPQTMPAPDRPDHVPGPAGL